MSPCFLFPAAARSGAVTGEYPIAGTGSAGPPARALTPPVAAGDTVQISHSDPEQIPAPAPGEPVFLKG